MLHTGYIYDKYNIDYIAMNTSMIALPSTLIRATMSSIMSITTMYHSAEIQSY